MRENRVGNYFRALDERDVITQYLEINGALETSRYIIEIFRDHLREEYREGEPIGEDLVKFIDTIEHFCPALLPLCKLYNYRNYVQNSAEEIVAALTRSIKEIDHSISSFGVGERHLSLHGVRKRVLVLGLVPQIRQLISAIKGIEEVRIIIPSHLSENNRRLLEDTMNRWKTGITDKQISTADSSNLEGEIASVDNIFLETWGVVERSLQGCVVHLPDQARALLKEASIAGKSIYGVASGTLQFGEELLLDGIARHLSYFWGIVTEDALHISESTGWGTIKEQV